MARAFRSFAWSVGLALCVSGSFTGCANMIENSTVAAFSRGLERNDLDRLKAIASSEFSERALRNDKSLEDLKALNLFDNLDHPDGKVKFKVVDIEEVSKDRKRMTVQIGENKKEQYYEIVRDDSGKWVVDNIFMKQKHKGIETYKSVTEQMDLLLTVREFTSAWTNGDREQVLSVATPKFRTALEQLPPRFLAQLTRQVSRGNPKSGQMVPKASIDEKVAVVKLPRSTGSTVLTMELRKGHWQVANVHIDAKDEDEKLPSALNLALAVNQCIAFLSAYQDDNKEQLSKVCTSDFFKGSLAFADLSRVKLPDPNLAEHDLQVRLRGNRADFVLRNEAEFVQIDMQLPLQTIPSLDASFVVSDVTIYEVESKQEKRLSALFTAQEMLEIFVEAISNRQVDKAKHCSTHDFATRVWSKLNESTITAMPLEVFDSTSIEIVSASYLGALTKIEVVQGGLPYTYLLREQDGRFMVDDIQWHVTGVPDSVKSTLEVLIPIQNFASGIALGRDADEQERALDLIRGNSSNDFNRMVWSQNPFIPNSGMSADTFLKSPLKSIAFGDDTTVVLLGDNRYGAKVTMIQENNHYIVDDVQLIAGPKESERLSLRNTLRSQLAKGEARRPQTIQQAGHTSDNNQRVQQAILEVESDARQETTTPANGEPRELDQLELEPVDTEPMTDDGL